MSDERSHHVTVRLLRGYEFIAEFDDVPGIPSMVIDEQKPPGGSNAPRLTPTPVFCTSECRVWWLTRRPRQWRRAFVT